MRNKIFLLITLFSFIAQSAFAIAYPTRNTVTWEYRSTATPGNVNGGGFCRAARDGVNAPGNDYSQQDTAHLVITDLAINATNRHAVSSVLTPFDAQDAGNVLHINVSGAPGFEKGWYVVLRVIGTEAILDKKCGLGGSTGGSAYLGGALSLLGADTQNLIASANTIYIKNSTAGYTLTSSCLPTIDGTIGFPIRVEGYKTIRDDDPKGLDRPYFIGGAYTPFGSGSTNRNYSNFRIMNSASAGTSIGDDCYIDNFSFVNPSTSIGRYALTTGSKNIITNSEMQSYLGPGVYTSITNYGIFIGNYIHDCYDSGIESNGGGTVLINNIFRNSDNISSECDANVLIANNGFSLIYGNTFYGTQSKSGYGVSQSSSSLAMTYISNNIFYGFKCAIAFPVSANNLISGESVILCNDFFNNIDNTSSNLVPDSTNYFLDPQFVNPAAGDFRIGGNLKGLGLPSNIISSNSVTSTSSVVCTNYLDLGAVQRPEITNTYGSAN